MRTSGDRVFRRGGDRSGIVESAVLIIKDEEHSILPIALLGLRYCLIDVLDEEFAHPDVMWRMLVVGFPATEEKPVPHLLPPLVKITDLKVLGLDESVIREVAPCDIIGKVVKAPDRKPFGWLEHKREHIKQGEGLREIVKVDPARVAI